MPYSSPNQTQDGVVNIQGRGDIGIPLELTVIDPPDLAPYAPAGGWGGSEDPTQASNPVPPYIGADNVAASGYTLSDGQATGNPIIVTPGSGKTYSVDLSVPPRNAGDNFQVRVRKVDPLGNPIPERVVGYSPIYTSWKRVYVERDRMFRKGGVLAEDYVPEAECGNPSNPLCDCLGPTPPACCTDPPPATHCNQMVVYEWQNAAVSDQIGVFDEMFPFESAAEFRTITAVGPADGDGLLVVTLDQGLALAHLSAQRTDVRPLQPTFSNYHSSGFGVTSGCDLNPSSVNSSDSCFFEPDLQGMEEPYADAYVEVFAPRSGMGAVPYVADEWFNLGNFSWMWALGHTWFANFGMTRASLRPTGLAEQIAAQAHNYYQFLGASGLWRVDGPNTFYILGLSSAPDDVTLLFRGSTEAYAGAQGTPGTVAQVNLLSRHTAVHEGGHQFWVNGCVSDGSGHDTRQAWCELSGDCGPDANVAQECVMATTTSTIDDRWDSSNRFCKEDLFLGDPTCPPPPPDPPLTAIRTQEDPF